MTLARFEMEELTGTGVDRLVTCVDAHDPVDDDEHCRLPHLMLAERLAGAELDQDDALGPIARVDDDGRPRPVRRLDLVELPVTHDGAVPHRRVP